jgi:hypothetical protein
LFTVYYQREGKLKHVVWVVILQLATGAADGFYTHKNMVTKDRTFHELDPLAKPFTKNTPDLVVSSLAGEAGSFYTQYWFRKHAHQRWSTALAISDITGHAYGATASALDYKRSITANGKGNN